MKNISFRKVLSVIAYAVVSALFIVLLYFCAPHIDAVTETEGTAEYSLVQTQDDQVISVKRVTAEIGKDFTTTRISDLGRLKKNHQSELCRRQIRQHELFKRGHSDRRSYETVCLCRNRHAHIRPHESRSVFERLQRTNGAFIEYKIGENWCFTLSLPKIICASNAYSKTALIARHGDIENYDFIHYNTSYDKKAENFSARIESTLIDLNFYTRRVALEDAFNAAQIVMRHYQSTGSAYAGITDAPLIGTKSAVANINETSHDLLTAPFFPSRCQKRKTFVRITSAIKNFCVVLP